MSRDECPRSFPFSKLSTNLLSAFLSGYFFPFRLVHTQINFPKVNRASVCLETFIVSLLPMG